MKLDIKFENVPEGDANERNKLYIAAGNFADVFWITTFPDVQSLGQNGQVVNILDYESSLVYYNAFLDQNKAKESVISSDGKIFSFTGGVTTWADISQNFFAYNIDVLAKHNISIPKTLDELYTACKTLKGLYPDSYPLDCSPEPFGLETIIGMTNHTHKKVYYNGDKFVLGILNDEAAWKQTLVYLNKFYSEKLMKPEFSTQTYDQLIQDAINGKSFVYPSFWGGLIGSSVNSSTQKVGRLGIAIRPNGFDGKIGWRWNEPKGNSLITWSNLCISSKAKNPELLVKLLDYEFAPEMIDMKQWGLEGTQYAIGSDGSKKLLATTKDTLTDLFSFSIGLWNNQAREPFAAREAIVNPCPAVLDGKIIDKTSYWQFSANEGEAAADPDISSIANLVRAKLTKDDTDKIAAIMTPIDTYLDETTIKFITGQMGFDKWDEFISTVKSMGDYQSILDIYNNILSKYK